MQTLPVKVPGKEYRIDIGRGILKASLISALERLEPESVAVVTDTNLEKYYPGKISEILQPTGIRVEECVLPDGERYKNLETLNRIFDFLMDKQANRKTLLVAFGGGVIGDMAGFAAATFMRGIPMIQVPTTLLAQVDSSVGGKTAVNHPKGKNTIGVFKQPRHVTIDIELLQTLPSRELRAGYFELVKHALAHEPELFEFLRPHVLEPLDHGFMEEAVYRSCRVKGRIVEEDETESGLRATLNFGHTLGHLIETHTGYTRYLHGEAVGTGMLFAAFLSFREGHLEESSWKEIRDYLLPLLVPVKMNQLTREDFRDLLLHDKKVRRRAVNFILQRRIGECFIQAEMPLDLIWEAFGDFLKEFPEVCTLVA